LPNPPDYLSPLSEKPSKAPLKNYSKENNIDVDFSFKILEDNVV
jgi:hypothetical protein